ncbi:MAG TPA: ABC transporter substrate-binding protein [Clostridia bacterium]|jgi:peptide/nickel transport system substrate-binding protein|nr:ABC transporter substrate-binding protein [Clostridia bacterium]HPK15360.1 ABC transporter substrate-binding protein [Clostridia bacterium]
MRVKRLFASLLCLFLLASCAGCTDKPATGGDGAGTTPGPQSTLGAPGVETPADTADPAPTYQETIRIGINAEPSTVLTPTKSTSAMCQMIARSTHSTLLDLDLETGEIAGDLAQDWSVSEDGTVYTFKLHEGVKFSNGEECTAEDVKYTLEQRVPNGALASLVTSIVSIEAVDAYTVKITLSGAVQDMKYTLAGPACSIVCKSAVEAGGDEGERYGTGAYSITEYVQGEYVLLTRNENYFGQMPNTKFLKFVVYLEDSTRQLALETGEIEVCYSPANSDLVYIQANEELDLISCTGVNIYYIGFNTQAEPFDNEKVRQAVACAVNKQDAITVAFDGYAEVATNVMAPAIPLYQEVSVWDYDVERAKALMTEAGYENGFQTTVWVDRADEEQMAVLFKENLKAIGIDLEIVRLEATTLKAKWGDDDYRMCIQKFGNTGGPGISFSYVFASTAAANRSRINDPRVDEMIAAAAVEQDSKVRSDMYKQLNEYITTTAYWVPVCIPQVFVGTKTGLEGAKYSGNTSHDFTYACLAEP